MAGHARRPKLLLSVIELLHLPVLTAERACGTCRGSLTCVDGYLCTVDVPARHG
jgi:hypothetical protein